VRDIPTARTRPTYRMALVRSRYGEDDRLQFVVADAGDLRLEAASIDLAVAQNVFHHLPSLWRELNRVLRPGGHLLSLDLTPTPLLRTLLRPLSSGFDIYDFDDIRAALREARFLEVAVRRPIRWLPLRHEPILRKA
jgi:SAM-dependent methyltransferase